MATKVTKFSETAKKTEKNISRYMSCSKMAMNQDKNNMHLTLNIDNVC
jgi:hypothetical protein